MTILYVDSTALLKRVVVEASSTALRRLLAEHDAAGDLLTASSLAWLEVWRALRRAGAADVAAAADLATSGIAACPLSELVLLRARRAGTDALRTLDAIHLATAVVVGADVIVTYDDRLAQAAGLAGFDVLAPAG